MLIVCSKCRKEMICKKTGSNIRFCGGKHVYLADQFECKECGATVNVSVSQSVFLPIFDKDKCKDWDVFMD
jgi:hypothetical protein